MFLATLCASAVALGHDSERSTLVLTSTNDPGGNQVVGFELDTDSTPELSRSACKFLPAAIARICVCARVRQSRLAERRPLP
jgi:hypothetical protein